MLRKGAEEARNRLPELLDAAEHGETTIITRHGRPVAALVPIATYGASLGQTAAAARSGIRPWPVGQGQQPHDPPTPRRMGRLAHR
jgi:prevent-host-death family protein